MSIERAIEILTALLESLTRKKAPELHDSIKLSIKALERFQSLRSAGKDVGMPLLKGEIPEVDNGNHKEPHVSEA